MDLACRPLRVRASTSAPPRASARRAADRARPRHPPAPRRGVGDGDDARRGPRRARAAESHASPTACPIEEAGSSLFAGFRNFVLARTDASVATLYNAQSGLFRTAVTLGGSPEQAASSIRWSRSFELTGAFALTEPEHGSDIAGGLVHDGAPRGRRLGASTGASAGSAAPRRADVLAVFARDTADGQVKAFLVDRATPRASRLETMRGKVSLRPMQNAVDHPRRRARGRGLPPAARRVVARRRPAAARHALRRRVDRDRPAGRRPRGGMRLCAQREQFGRPIGGFQLVQEKLARMLGNVTASLAMVVQLSHAAGRRRLRRRELRTREDVDLAARARDRRPRPRGRRRQRHPARARRRPFFADAEAVYSYEGTHEINSLIVGRSLTGVVRFHLTIAASPRSIHTKEHTMTTTARLRRRRRTSPAPTSATPTGSRSRRSSVNTFADATGDHQWIHVDPERAKDGPFGGADRARVPHPVARREVLDRPARGRGRRPRRSTTASTRCASSRRSRSARACA